MPEVKETVLIDTGEIRPNEWNPNEMAATDFNALVENMDEIGVVQQVLVAPLDDDPEGYKYRIVDGEHRFEAMRLSDTPQIPCVIVDIDEDAQKFQTVKMNKLRGKLNKGKFINLVQDLTSRHGVEEVAARMAFTDPTELEALIENVRKDLPPEMQNEFDAATKEIQSVDDLTLVLNRLFTQYGDTLPYNFMIMDFGGKDHLWVRFDNRRDYRTMEQLARRVKEQGFTFDSFVMAVLTGVSVEAACKRLQKKLIPVEETDA